jgi:hypothetical protein
MASSLQDAQRLLLMRFDWQPDGFPNEWASMGLLISCNFGEIEAVPGWRSDRAVWTTADVFRFSMRNIDDDYWASLFQDRPLLWLPHPLLQLIGQGKWSYLFGRATWDNRHRTLGTQLRSSLDFPPSEWVNRCRRGFCL